MHSGLIPDEIIRSDRKTLSIVVDSFGRLIVKAPKRCGEERIFAFIREKQNWILRKKAERVGVDIALPTDDLHGYLVWILGEKYEIHLTDGTHIELAGEEKRLYLPRKNAQTRLVKWLKDNAKRIFTRMAERISQEMGCTYKSLSVTSARSRWGSCSAENALRFSFRLLYAPKEVVEYVVTHELAHTRHKNHSARFWAEVAKYQPEWKKKRNWLKLHGALMQIF